MKKKILAVLLTGLLFTCTACGSPESPVIPEVTGSPIAGKRTGECRNGDCIAAGGTDRDCCNRQSGDCHRGF